MGVASCNMTSEGTLDNRLVHYWQLLTLQDGARSHGRPGAPNRADPARAGPIILGHDYTKSLSLRCHELKCGHCRSTSQYKLVS